jgi:hypothetical protein
VTEDERDDLIDLLPKDMAIWDDEDEIIAGHAADLDLTWWMNAIGHPKAHPGCCKSCGCATTCMAGAFHAALVSSVVGELDRIGALQPITTIHLPGDGDCCDLHNVHCEPPGDLCCADCTEARHPDHPAGTRCVLEIARERMNGGGA